MAWIYGMASGIRASNKASSLITLFRNVMMIFAQALQIVPIPKQFRIASVRLFMIDNRSRYNSPSFLAHLAKRLVP
jgi:hypothetical protein